MLLGPCVEENRDGLLIYFQIGEANGAGERRTVIEMDAQNLARTSLITLGADKAYDTADLIATCRALNVAPRVAGSDRRRAARRWTVERCGTRATSSTRKSASGLRGSSAGSRP